MVDKFRVTNKELCFCEQDLRLAKHIVANLLVFKFIYLLEQAQRQRETLLDLSEFVL
jgi:hypothetical protein